MGRPLNKRYFKGGSSNPIKVLAKFPDGEEKEAIIERQNGARRYVVSNGIRNARCQLVGKEPGTLSQGEMIMSATNSDDETVRILKLTTHNAYLSDDSNHHWGFDAADGDKIQMETFVDGEYVVEPTVESAVTLNPDVTTEANNFIVGVTNPTNNMVQGSNNEIEIACRIGEYRKGITLYPLSDTTYTVNTGGNKDWNFAFSFYLVNNPQGKALTDLYDISMHITAEHIDMLLTLILDVNGVYHLTSPDGHTIDIIDGYTNDIKSVYQNIQRLSFVAAALGQPVNSVGAALGEIHIDFTATRKVGDFDPVELNVVVNAS